VSAGGHVVAGVAGLRMRYGPADVRRGVTFRVPIMPGL
jgi:hypothetical protein